MAWEAICPAEGPGTEHRKLYLQHLVKLANWRSVLAERSINALFIATEEVPDQDEVRSLAEHLIRGKVFYVSSWGAGCELVHDLFDEQEAYLKVEAQISEDQFANTTWHDDEPIADALEFFWTCAATSDEEQWGPTYLALSVGSEQAHAALVEAAGALCCR